MHQENKSKIDFLVRIIVWGLVVILLISLVRNISRSLSADERIKQANDELSKIANENSKLKDELEIVGSDYFKEKEARDSLGLSKPGDIVLVLPPDDEIRKLAPERVRKEVKLPNPNWKKWLSLFF